MDHIQRTKETKKRLHLDHTLSTPLSHAATKEGRLRAPTQQWRLSLCASKEPRFGMQSQTLLPIDGLHLCTIECSRGGGGTVPQEDVMPHRNQESQLPILQHQFPTPPLNFMTPHHFRSSQINVAEKRSRHLCDPRHFLNTKDDRLFLFIAPLLHLRRPRSNLLDRASHRFSSSLYSDHVLRP